jgi:murein DD-endopeptidase MepM/ murein hydrolase activator NlpD
MADERRLTFIVVPHGDLETRTFAISYRTLRLLLGAVGGLLVLFIIMVASWWYVAAQAARVPGLEKEVAELREERKKVAEFARTLAEVEAQYERVRQLLGASSEAKQPAEPLLPPLRQTPPPPVAEPEEPAQPDAWPLSEAGYVTRRMATGRFGHPGVDIAVPTDSYIRAAGAGVVAAAGTDSVYGEFVLIDHGGGVQSMYGHASRIFVAPGDRVERHEVIALSGSTGRSTAPHLHFEVRRNGEAIDPLVLIRQP